MGDTMNDLKTLTNDQRRAVTDYLLFGFTDTLRELVGTKYVSHNGAVYAGHFMSEDYGNLLQEGLTIDRQSGEIVARRSETSARAVSVKVIFTHEQEERIRELIAESITGALLRLFSR